MVLNLFKFLGNSKKGFKRRSISPETIKKVKEEWKNIDILLKGKSPSQLRQAIISADKTLDNVLRDKVSGEYMGERLKKAKDLFEWDFYQKIWNSHKIRNSLVHESGYEPPHHMIKDGVEVFRQAVNNLGVKV